MLIQVRVQLEQAQKQIATLQSQLAGLQKQNAAASAASASGGIGSVAAISSIKKFGNQIQWAGRQLQYNFTLPIVLAGGLATKWALQNEAAMVRVSKVYGDGSQSVSTMNNELKALGKNFEALSNRYGIAQSDVINLAADWAAAGASGVALAKSTELTIKTMILGEMDAKSATQALIAIQAQYGLAVDDNKKGVMDLRKVVELLNNVENQTGTSMGDLVISLSKSAGAARVAGVDILHLAAFTAALVPAAGTAATAGNALKTIFTRILAPGKQAIGVLKQMGIDANTMAWKSKSGTQQLLDLAASFEKLSSSQKNAAAKTLAGVYQISRFDVLMKALVSDNSYYAKALRAGSDEVANHKQAQKELNMVLDSQPQKLKIIGQTMKNSLAAIIQPLLPLIIMLANSVAAAARAFENLNPQVQHMVLIGLLVLALVGPITRYVGSITLLFGVMAEVVMFFIRGPFRLLGAAFKIVMPLFRLIGTVIEAIIPVLAFLGSGFLKLGGLMLNVAKVAFAPVLKMLFSFGASLLTMVGPALIAFASVVWEAMASAGAAIAAFATEVLGAGLLNAVRTAMTYMGVIILEGFARIGPMFTALWAGIETLFIKGLYLLDGVMAAFGAGFTAIWAAINNGIRAIWVATWAFLSSTERMASALGAVFTFGTTLIGYFAKLGPALLGLLTNPWTLAILAVGTAIALIVRNVKGGFGGIGNWLKNIWHSVAQSFSGVTTFFSNAINGLIKAFYKLPEGVQSAMLAVLHIVEKAAEGVYKLFSYLNPFAHHSPSLVENVTGGMSIVRDEHSKTSKSAVQHTSTIASAHRSITNTMSTSNASSSTSTTANDVAAADAAITRALADMAKLQKAAKSIIPSKFADDIKAIKAQLPSVLPLFMTLLGDYTKLNTLLDAQKTKVDAQQKVVDLWAAKLDAANTALDAQQTKLSGLQKNLDGLQSQYDAANSAMQGFANAPIQGMKAMSDQIFNNSEAQKKLQLQMLQWQQVNGSLDDINAKMQKLAGGIEKLRGESTQLRLAGAGSDVTGPLDAQVKAMQDQYDTLQKLGQNNPINDLQKQLDALQQQGQILQLTSDITFDPLTKQIQDLANAQKEIPYDQIIAGITNEKAIMDGLAPSIDAATAAVNKQQAAVDAATAARDAIQTRYDAENKKLQVLKDQYDKINEALQSVTDTLNSMGSAAQDALSKASAAAAGSLGAAANYPDVGGDAKIGREGGNGDQSANIQDLTDKLAKDASKAMGGFGDIFKPIKEAWNKTWDWITTNLGPVGSNLLSGIKAVFSGLGDTIGGAGKGISSALSTPFNDAKNIVIGVIHGIQKLIELFWPDIKRLFDTLASFVMNIWNRVGPTIIKFINQIKPLAELIGIVIVGYIKIAADVFTHVLGPALNAIVGIVDSLMNIFGGLVDFVKNILTGDFGKAWDDIVQIVKGAWDLIYSIFSGTFGVIIGIVQGFIDGVVGFFKWLYDILVGHSLIPDLMREIVAWFNWLIAPVKLAFSLIWTAIKAVWNGFILPLFEGIKVYFKAWAAIFGWVYNNIIKPAWDALWNGLKLAWNTVGVPFVNGVKAVISTIGTIFTDLKNTVTGAWNAVWNAIKYTWDHLGKGIFSAIAGGFVTIVNAAIWAIDAIIKGINGISGLLHLGFSIKEIDKIPAPTFAEGGYLPHRRVGSGFKTNGARAIVGEGGQYPEFVIPTDPRYRKRAQGLWAQTGRAIQMLAQGGSTDGSSGKQGSGSQGANTNYPRGNVTNAQVIADIKTAQAYNTHVWSASRSVADQIGDDIQGAIATIGGLAIETAMKGVMIPVKLAADTFFSHVPVEFIKKTGLAFDASMYKKLTNIASGKDSPLSSDPVKRFAPVAAEAVLKLHFGGDQNSGNTKRALLDAAMNVPDILARLSKESGGDPNAINNWDSNAAAGHPSKGLMQVIDPTYQAYKGSFGSGSIWDPRANMYAGLNYAQHRYGTIRAGMDQPGGYFMGGILPMFANGGIAKQATAGVFGESGHEILAPLTPLWNRLDRIESKVDSVKSSGDTNVEIHFHGDLSFPNVKSGSDAGDFLDNIKTLAGK